MNVAYTNGEVVNERIPLVNPISKASLFCDLRDKGRYVESPNSVIKFMPIIDLMPIYGLLLAFTLCPALL